MLLLSITLAGSSPFAHSLLFTFSAPMILKCRVGSGPTCLMEITHHAYSCMLEHDHTNQTAMRKPLPI